MILGEDDYVAPTLHFFLEVPVSSTCPRQIFEYGYENMTLQRSSEYIKQKLNIPMLNTYMYPTREGET